MYVCVCVHVFVRHTCVCVRACVCVTRVCAVCVWMQEYVSHDHSHLYALLFVLTHSPHTSSLKDDSQYSLTRSCKIYAVGN